MKSLRTTAAAIAAILVASLAVGVARADVKSGEKSLLDALKKADNSTAVEKACDELIQAGGSEAIGVLLKILPRVRPDASGEYYWQMIGGAGGFKDRGALEALGKFILANGKAALGKDLLFSLQSNSSNYAIVPLQMVLEKGGYDLQLMSVDQLANIRSIDSVDALVSAVAREQKGSKDKELIRRIDLALQVLTGENLGPDNWEAWWKEQKPKGLPEKKKAAEPGPGGAPAPAGGTRERDNADLGKGDAKGVVVISSDRTMLKDKDPNKPVKDARNYDYDHMQAVLDQLKIPHTVVAKEEFEADPAATLKSAYCVLVNCANFSVHCICPTCKPGGSKENRMMHCTGCDKHEPVGWKLKDPAVEAIRVWVESGGYLFTEDMGVIEIIDRAWPALVKVHEVDAKNPGNVVGPDGKPLPRNKPLLVKEGTVKLLPGRGNTTHPLMRGVWVRQKSMSEQAEDAAKRGDGNQTTEKSPAKALEHKWHVDDESPAFHVVDGKTVVTLLESEELGKMADGETSVAVTFRVGKGSSRQATGAKGGAEFAVGGGGRVLHTMSHFGKQDGSQDGQALLNLILNFLVEARKHHEAARGGK